MIGYDAKKRLFDSSTNQINFEAAIILAICAFCIIIWTIFYLLYFTKQRTKNPQLYDKGFVSDFSVKDKENESE